MRLHPSTTAIARSSLGFAAAFVVAASTSAFAIVASTVASCTCSWFLENGAVACMGSHCS